MFTCKLAAVHRTARKEFINAKYIDRKFVRRSVSMATSRLDEVYEAVRSRDLLSLIQLCAEGVELLQPLPEPGKVGRMLHLSVITSSWTSGLSIKDEAPVCSCVQSFFM